MTRSVVCIAMQAFVLWESAPANVLKVPTVCNSARPSMMTNWML